MDSYDDDPGSDWQVLRSIGAERRATVKRAAEIKQWQEKAQGEAYALRQQLDDAIVSAWHHGMRLAEIADASGENGRSVSTTIALDRHEKPLAGEG